MTLERSPSALDSLSSELFNRSDLISPKHRAFVSPERITNTQATVLVAIAITSVAALLMLAGWTDEAPGPPLPRKCSSADTQRRATLFSGAYRNPDGGGGYARFCGPGRAVVRVGVKSFTIQGGRCDLKSPSPRVHFGLAGNGSAKPMTGFAAVLERGTRPGRNRIIDSSVVVGGASPAGPSTGTAIVAKGLKSATFSIGRAPTRVTGSWTCG